MAESSRYSHFVLPSLEATGEWPWRPVDLPVPRRKEDELPIAYHGEVRFRDHVEKSAAGDVSSYTMQIAFSNELRGDLVLDSLRAISAHIPLLLVQARTERFEARLKKLAEVYLVDDPLDEAYLALHEQQLKARQRLLESMPMLEAKQVARFAGHENKNTAQTAFRWKSAGKVFSVPVAGTDRYPEFQFKVGQPKPIIEELLRLLHPKAEWDLAFWFASANPWLEGMTPVSVLDGMPQRVLEAAQHAHDQISD
jgi:hypothetical protein